MRQRLRDKFDSRMPIGRIACATFDLMNTHLISPRSGGQRSFPLNCGAVNPNQKRFNPPLRQFALGLLLLAQLQSPGQTNFTRSPLERLESRNLQAVHETRQRFAQERRLPPSHGLYDDYRAVMHIHAEDADHTKGTRPEMLAAARTTGVQVVFTTDHRGPKSEAWRGLREGVLFIAGSETGSGTLWFPDFDSNGQPIPDSGYRFLSHVEERYDADTEGMVGMEIVNRHTDAILDRRLEQYLKEAAADPDRWRKVVADFQSFPDEFFGAGTDYRPEMLAKFDRETQAKRFTGIAANDAHQNVIIQGVTFDPYEVSFRNLTTHILARGLTEPLIREALTNGQVYVAHDWLCDPSGFMFGAVNNLGVFNMGDSALVLGRTRLMAVTPLTAKLKLIHKGDVIHEATGTNLTFEAKETGPYRVEAWLTVNGEDRPWIYSNPVYLRGPALSDLILPSMEISPDVEQRKDFAYREGPEADATRHKLDVYVPKGTTNAPVFFFVHGGAWRMGDRSQYPPLGNRYALEGLVTVVPSYRLAPNHLHPAQIEDVAAAFAWTVRHIAGHGGDTNRIYVGGHSAGGHLAALLCLDERHLAAHGISPKHIRGVLALSGVYDLTGGEGLESVFGRDAEVRRVASPQTHIRRDAPPFLVTYCQWDYFSLPGQARAFHRALQQAGVAAELVYVPGENHISEMLKVSSQEDLTVAAALKFMK